MNLLRALLRHPSGRIGGFIILVYLLLALAAAVGLTPHDPIAQDRLHRLSPPDPSFWMGTDLFGRDVLSRLMAGIEQSFIVAFLSVIISALAGVAIGLLSAWWGGLWDGTLMRLMDILLAFPAVLLALLIVTVLGPGTFTSVIAIAIVYTPIFARVARGPALSLKSREFVEAARTFGSSQIYVLTRHLLLNLVAPLTVQVTLALAWALLTEAALSFLGLGTQPPAPSLGLMLADSKNLLETAPWLMLFPGLAVMLGILGFNLLGDALRDIVDPRSRRRQS
ncbi:MAG TPA: ABC transporter permease [Devosia sp.]|nr:ABC transporter permease [Devosia sp.]